MSVESVRGQLGEDAELLDFEEEGEYIVIRFKHYQPKEVFNRVYAEIRNLNGDYVSEGKLSHFKVKKEGGLEPSGKAEHVLGDKKKLLVKDALAYLDDLEDDFKKKIAIVREKLKELQK